MKNLCDSKQPLVCVVVVMVCVVVVVMVVIVVVCRIVGMALVM